MAFNPFNFFRKNQKILFAMLTIMVMFMFVLSSGIGRGDFFQWFPEWLGQQRGAGGETVATINGRKLTTGQLAQTNQMRMRANEVALRLAERASNTIAKQLEDATSKADRESGQLVIHNFFQSRQMGYINFQEYMALQNSGRQVSNDDILNMKFNEIRRQSQILFAMSGSPNSKAEDKELANIASLLVKLDYNRMTSPTYFQTVPMKTTNDNFEFELWLKKAEKLGITITPIDAEFLLYAELAGRVGESDWKEVVREVQARDARLTSDSIRRAIADEFRVRLAQTAVLGKVAGDASADQSAASPYQVYQYFRQQCDEATYAVLAVPAENFLSNVTEQPTDAQLRELFTKYRTREPNPSQEQPGFKEPRKLKLEWLQAKGDEPFFATAAKDAMAKAEIQAKVAGLAIVPLGPCGVMASVTAPATVTIKTDDILESVYNSYKTGAEFNIRSNWDFNFLPSRADVTDPSVAKPTNLAAFAATFAGSLMGIGSPLTGPIVLVEKARMEERNAKARAQVSAFLVPLIGSNPIGGAMALAARIPQPLPLAVLRPDAEKKVRERLARQLCYNDLEKFQTEVAKLGKGIDKSGAKDFIEKFIKERNLTRGESKGFFDQFNLYSDAGLTPLFDVYKKLTGKDGNPIGFGGLFFFEQDMRGQTRPSTTFFAPAAYPPQSLNEQSFVGGQLADAPTEPALLAWRTAEEVAVEPKNMDDAKVKAKVVAAWKLSKARDLAKAKAEELAKLAPTYGTNEEVIRGKMIDVQAAMKSGLTDKVSMDRVKYFEIPNVAPVTGGQAFMAGRNPVQFFRYSPNENVPYATPEMTLELLKNRDKPVVSAIVLTDNPKDNYYVAVIMNKYEKLPFEFSKGIYAPLSPNPNSQELGGYIRNSFQTNSSNKTREMAVNLLKAEFKVENENAKILSEKGGDAGE